MVKIVKKINILRQKMLKKFLLENFQILSKKKLLNNFRQDSFVKKNFFVNTTWSDPKL
jgi:hypothetical protein